MGADITLYRRLDAAKCPGASPSEAALGSSSLASDNRILARRLQCLLGSPGMGDWMAGTVRRFNAQPGAGEFVRTHDGLGIRLALMRVSPLAAAEQLQGLRQSGALRLFEDEQGRKAVVGLLDFGGGVPREAPGFVLLDSVARRLGFDLGAPPSNLHHAT